MAIDAGAFEDAAPGLRIAQRSPVSVEYAVSVVLTLADEGCQKEIRARSGSASPGNGCVGSMIFSMMIAGSADFKCTRAAAFARGTLRARSPPAPS